ncbi:MAG: helix-turn-helix transcriptional regulator [Clostridia bacterium]|nr:helix-turn-helix transcriptional regulator [Clostridia bacterium]
MDQIKIGKFIAKCRRAKNLTQAELAEKLHITDRAISKWETGRGMPDSAIMLALCQALEIDVNDLLHGEIVTMQDYKSKSEELLLEMSKQKEQADRQLLSLEVLIGILSTVILLGGTLIGGLIEMPTWTRIVIIAAGFVLGITGFFFALKIEQTAGYYECKCCGHKYVPSIKAVTMAPHMGRTRKMTCPACGKKCWHKKVICKD